MANATSYRTCPRSGLQFEANAEKLMLANAVAAVVFLLIGGILAVGVVLTRWPAVHWLEADTFYQVLTAHGIDMLIFWIIFFEIAVLYFCSSTLLRCRLATPNLAWLAFALMLIGAVTNNVAVLPGRLERDDDVLRADDGRAVVLPRADPVRGRRADRLLRVPGHAGDRQARQDLPGLGAAGDLRRDHRLHHRGVHDRLGRDHPDPDLPDVGGHRQGGRPAGLPHHLVGLRPLVAADQRRGAHLDLVRGGGHRLRRQADERARQPRRLPALHPVPATGQRAPPARRPGPVAPAGKSSTPATSCTSRCSPR